ncbi:MAG TPA: NAD(P)H-dependent oxidoreductase [Dongiaceae bacterium]|nr:NAD(P)H-dependent oxidoreductase [Dongiaceae bacterium]
MAGGTATRRIAIIQGHPHPKGGRFCHALADAYAAGAEAVGHAARRVEVARLDFPILRTQTEFETAAPTADIRAAQDAIRWAEHLVIVYPLWLGTMPALLKGFFEQAFRPGFAFEHTSKGLWRKRLKGRSARIVVTMGMPAFVYRWYFGAHGLKSLERNILGFCGIGPIRESLVGMVEAGGDKRRRIWLAKMTTLGRRGV